MHEKDREESEKESRKRWMLILYGIAAVLSCLIIIEVLVWIFHFRGGFAWQEIPKKQFNWHIFLMVLSMVIINGHGVMTYRLLRYEPKRRLKIFHAFSMIVALGLAVVGLKAVYDSHDLANPPLPNLQSLHSWIGIVTATFFAAQWMLGFSIFLIPGIRFAVRSVYMPLHIYTGFLILAMATAACLSGLLEKSIFINASLDKPEGVLINTIGVSIMALVMVVVLIVSRPEFKRQPLPEEEFLRAEKLSEQDPE